MNEITPLAEAIKLMDKDARYQWLGKMVAETVASQVLDMRTKRGWTQKQLAKHSGLSTLTIHRIENKKNTSVGALIAIAAAFDVALMVSFVSWSEMLSLVVRISRGGIDVTPLPFDEEFLTNEVKSVETTK